MPTTKKTSPVPSNNGSDNTKETSSSYKAAKNSMGNPSAGKGNSGSAAIGVKAGSGRGANGAR